MSTFLLVLAAAAVASPFAALAAPQKHSPFSSLMRRQSTCDSTTTVQSCTTDETTGTCCLEAPGGLLALTQFWDYKPALGPADSWTIHGLWPDHCDGTFDASCDPSRAYSNLTQILSTQGAQDTLSFMQTYWKDLNGDDESFWEHEWSKHGTCMSTLEPSCLPPGSPVGAEAVIYFEKLVDLFKSVPTYQWLAQQGIVPTKSKTYTSAQIMNALTTGAGVQPYISCKGSTLNQVWYYYNLQGSAIDGEFIPIDRPSFDSNNCPKNGIKYLPKEISRRN